MEFVVEILKRFFHLPETLATQVMLQVHIQGRGVCGVFTRDIAETKVALVNDYARVNEHPLLVQHGTGIMGLLLDRSNDHVK